MCFNCVSRMFQGSLKVFQGSLKVVSRKYQGCFKEISGGVSRKLKCHKVVFLVFQGSFKDVSRKFQGCSKGVSRLLQLQAALTSPSLFFLP